MNWRRLTRKDPMNSVSRRMVVSSSYQVLKGAIFLFAANTQPGLVRTLTLVMLLLEKDG